MICHYFALMAISYLTKADETILFITRLSPYHILRLNNNHKLKLTLWCRRLAWISSLRNLIESQQSQWGGKGSGRGLVILELYQSLKKILTYLYLWHENLSYLIFMHEIFFTWKARDFLFPGIARDFLNIKPSHSANLVRIKWLVREWHDIGKWKLTVYYQS